MKDAKGCRSCPAIVRDTPALKRHCSKAHRQDIDGNPISVELFPCKISTCHKSRVPFKRREKLAKHILTYHSKTIEGQEVDGGASSGERHAALPTNHNLGADNNFGGNHEAARVSARGHYDSAETNIWDPTGLKDFFPLPIDVHSAPVAKATELVSDYVRSQFFSLGRCFVLTSSDSKYTRICRFST
jgi:hypothetical protein